MSLLLLRPLFLLALGALAFAGAARADLLITELSSKSAMDPEDYFELTNTGNSAFDLTGWKFDDENATLADAAPIGGVTSIAPGESVVIIQLDTGDATADVAAFRGSWGGLPGVQVGYHDGAGLGKGDAINLFDAADNLALTLEYGMTLPEQTHAGDWGAANTDGSDTYENEAAVLVPGTDPLYYVLSAPGVYGSFANTSGEYGSPGSFVPEPTAGVMLLLAALGCGATRRS